MKFYYKKLLPAILLSFFLLNSCGIYKKTDARKIPTNANDRIKKNMEEGRGFRLGKLNNFRPHFYFKNYHKLLSTVKIYANNNFI